jgi:hypothetical protein
MFASFIMLVPSSQGGFFAYPYPPECRETNSLFARSMLPTPYLNILSHAHRNTAAAAAAITPNLASKNACAVGTAAPVEPAVVARAAITLLTMLN